MLNGSSTGTRPYGGLKPTMPLNDAGMRIEPPMSEPLASGGRACGQGRARPSAGAADRVVQVPRVAGDAVELGVREAGAAELWRRRARVDDAAGVEDAFTDGRRLLGDDVLEGQRRHRGRLALDLDLVLEADRQPLERTRVVGVARVDRLGSLRLLERAVVVGEAERVDVRLDGVRARDRRLQQLDGRQLAAAELRERVGGGDVVQLSGVCHGRDRATPRPAPHTPTACELSDAMASVNYRNVEEGVSRRGGRTSRRRAARRGSRRRRTRQPGRTRASCPVGSGCRSRRTAPATCSRAGTPTG